jgi:hypothetical protein
MTLTHRRDGRHGLDLAHLCRAALAQAAGTAADPPQPLPEPISQAEARVLRLLQTSLSAPEIARELYVSVNTACDTLNSGRASWSGEPLPGQESPVMISSWSPGQHPATAAALIRGERRHEAKSLVLAARVGADVVPELLA